MIFLLSFERFLTLFKVQNIVITIAESASRFNEITTKVGFLVELQKLILTQ